MNRLQTAWRRIFDIREGEHMRTLYMGLYLMIVLFAYYIIKPVSRAMFLGEFDIDKLPYLYILIAALGGAMAYFYTKLAIHTSLTTAVNTATFGMMGMLVLIWWLLSFRWEWMLYAFNVFVSLFSITLVSQGWLIAANVFTTREAKRLYGILGVGAVIGAAFGGSFTSLTVRYVGNRNLLLASAFMVFLAWLAFLGVARQKGVSLKEAKGAEQEETFSFHDIYDGVRRYRHLQVIIAIIVLTYIVDVMIEFQFNAAARAAYGTESDDPQAKAAAARNLTVFLGTFYGIWLNLLTFFLQFFLTAAVVSRFGVGGALQIMPVSISLTSLGVFLSPNIWSTGAARLTEAATRYSFNKTGMELLYLPLPLELRNRTKAFTDIFVDRFARGLGGIILLVLHTILNMQVRHLAIVVIGICAAWMLLSVRARREYISTVRKRLESRRLDLESMRLDVNEAGTVALLEQTLDSPNPRQSAYALQLLSTAEHYPIDARLVKAADSTAPELRAAAYEIALQRGFAGLRDNALTEIRNARPGQNDGAVKPAVEYALATAEDRPELARRLLTHPNPAVAERAMEALAAHPANAAGIVTREWVAEAAASPEAGKRALAAIGVRLLGEQDSPVLHKLLLDPEPHVAEVACRTAAVTQNRTYLDGLLKRLSSAQLRGTAIEALAGFGERIVGTLGDVLLDETMPLSVRRQIPRVLQRIGHQRSVDVLFQALGLPDLTLRSAILKALNRLRENNPKLNYGRDSVMQHIWNEARYYYQMHAALEPFRESNGSAPARLLSSTLESRLRDALERLFRLLGLRYPPQEIRAAYLAVNRGKSEEYTAALEFLDNILEPELKKIVLPLLDDATADQRGRELFGIEELDAKAAVRELLRSGDSWLVACAIATAADLKLHELRGDIEPLSDNAAGPDVAPVARAALAAMA